MPRVSHVFAHAWAKDFVIFLFLDTFRIQGILSFSCFQTLFVFKGFCHFRVSGHFPYSMSVGAPRESRFCWCKGFCRFPVSRHFPYSRDFVVSLFPNTLNFQKCLETGKRLNPLRKSLFSRDIVISPVYRQFLDSKVSRNRIATKPLEKIIIFKGFSCF